MNYMVKTLEISTSVRGQRRRRRRAMSQSRCRLVARDFKRKREGRHILGDASVGGKESVVHVRWQECARRGGKQGQHEVKLIGVKETHFNAKCEEVERVDTR